MGIERNILETIDLKYFYPSEYVNDPYNLGKNYKPKEIFEMMYDAEESSKIYQKWDPHDIVPGSVNKNVTMASSIYNLVSPEGLRGIFYENAGELGIMSISVHKSDAYRIGNMI